METDRTVPLSDEYKQKQGNCGLCQGCGATGLTGRKVYVGEQGPECDIERFIL